MSSSQKADFSYLEFRTMDKTQKHSESECYTQSSEIFNFYKYKIGSNFAKVFTKSPACDRTVPITAFVADPSQAVGSHLRPAQCIYCGRGWSYLSSRGSSPGDRIETANCLTSTSALGAWDLQAQVSRELHSKQRNTGATRSDLWEVGKGKRMGLAPKLVLQGRTRRRVVG
jgi:hypothetical protein